MYPQAIRWGFSFACYWPRLEKVGASFGDFYRVGILFQTKKWIGCREEIFHFRVLDVELHRKPDAPLSGEHLKAKAVGVQLALPLLVRHWYSFGWETGGPSSADGLLIAYWAETSC
ncbi:hypothetical protein AAHA92_27929 [Salvia divinorum]|uniref:Uncharacterized protein n=1 Tax=Salvia divinorum TaxID=28513 RepID=A0ABD1G5A8_SALDI